jgi:hypothetical protein
MAMSSEEGETLCLTTNSLERYNRTLKKLVGTHPNQTLHLVVDFTGGGFQERAHAQCQPGPRCALQGQQRQDHACGEEI